jgi:hypothetical protein
MKTPLERLLHETPDYTFLRFLGVLVIPISDPIIAINLIFGRRCVSFWAIDGFIKDTNISMFHLIESTSLGTLFL